jgi:hypothetical protein
MAMKSKYEVQMRVLKLKQMADDPKAKRAGIPMLIAAEDALAWVLGTNDEDGSWSMQSSIDEQENSAEA